AAQRAAARGAAGDRRADRGRGPGAAGGSARGAPAPACRRRRGAGPRRDRGRPAAPRRRAGAGGERAGPVAPGAVPAHGPLRHASRLTPMRWLRRLSPGLVVTVLAVASAAAAAGLATWLVTQDVAPWSAWALAVGVVAPLLWWQVRRAFAPVASLFRALAGTVASYRDGDYGFGLAWEGSGPLRELVDAHNRLGEVLREQRHALV